MCSWLPRGWGNEGELFLVVYLLKTSFGSLPSLCFIRNSRFMSDLTPVCFPRLLLTTSNRKLNLASWAAFFWCEPCTHSRVSLTQCFPLLWVHIGSMSMNKGQEDILNFLQGPPCHAGLTPPDKSPVSISGKYPSALYPPPCFASFWKIWIKN